MLWKRQLDILQKVGRDKIKCLVNVSSSASGKSTYKSVKKVCEEYEIKILEDSKQYNKTYKTI